MAAQLRSGAMNDRGSNPWRGLTDARLTFALKILMVVVLAIYTAQFAMEFLDRIRGVVYVLIGSIFFSYLIYPAVQWLRRRMPLGAAIAVVYAAILVGVVVAVWLIVPRLVDETQTLVQRYPDFVVRMNALVNDPNDPVTSRLPDFARSELGKLPTQIVAWGRLHGLEAFSHILSVLAGTFVIVATFVIIPLITAYLLLDLDNLKLALASIVPEAHWRATTSLLSDIDRVFGGFVRGQLLVALTVGILITVAMTILRVPYPFLLGLVAAVGDLVPYVGAILAFIPAFLSALINNGIGNSLIVAVAFVAIFEAEGHIIAPNIVSKTVRLSPFAVLLAILAGAELGGIIGALVAIPVLGALRVIALRVFRPREANEPQP
ncbi:MAG: AI-2E family transporter [Candidatus Eremiobacteraeota bacterium]|nr:AI-2E family transporter [Candidatus Eremiobacteraeota bacterium]